MEPCRDTNCSGEELVLFHYGDLDEESRSRVEAHLSGCPACQAELAEIGRMLSLFPRNEIELSTVEIQRFAARVSSRAPRRRRRAWPALGGALAAAAVLAVALLTLQPGGEVAPQVIAHTKVSRVADAEVVRNLDLLQNLDLLENLETLQALEGHG